MSTTLVLTHSAWSSGLLMGLSALREAGLKCDVKILLSDGGQTIAHSCVLSAASPFFKSLLVQIENPEIDMSSFPSEVIQQILAFIYTGEATFDTEDLLVAHKVASMFNVTILTTLIQDVLLQNKSGDDTAVVQAEGATWHDDDDDEFADIDRPSRVAPDDEGETRTFMMEIGGYPGDSEIGGAIRAVQAENGEFMEADLSNIPNIMMKLRDDNESHELEPHQIHEAHDELEEPHKLVIHQLHRPSELHITPSVDHAYTPQQIHVESVDNDVDPLVSGVLGTLGNVVNMLGTDRDNVKPRTRKAGNRERPIKIISKDVPNDGSVPERAYRTLPDELFLQESRHAPADTGVVTKISIPRGSTLGPFEGDIITDPNFISQVDKRYCWSIFRDGEHLHWLSGEVESRANWLRYVRIGAGVADGNLKTFQNRGRLFFEVLRRINPLEELVLVNTIHLDAMVTEVVGDVGSADLGDVEGEVKDRVKDKVKDKDMGVVSDPGYPCEECDIIFLMEDMYHRHMHAMHGVPLPIDHFTGNDGKPAKLMWEAMVLGKPRQQGKIPPGSPPGDGNTSRVLGRPRKQGKRPHNSPGDETPSKSEVSITAQTADDDESRSEEMLELPPEEDSDKLEGMYLDKTMKTTKVTKKARKASLEAMKQADDQAPADVVDMPDVSADVGSDEDIETQESCCHSEKSSPSKRPLRTRRVSKRFRDYQLLSTDKDKHKLKAKKEPSKTVKDSRGTGNLKRTRHQTRLNNSSPTKQETNSRENNGALDLDYSIVKTELEEETEQKSADSSDKPHVCKPCGKGFKLESSYDRHRAKIHAADESSQIKCDQCNRRFTHLGNLQVHMRTHTGEKPFECEVCQRGFSQKGNLLLHMKRHRGENKHTCDQCGKGYNDRSYLLKHIRSQHQGTGGVECPICGKTLYDKASLRRHLITHTDTKLFKCAQCGKGFNQFANLRSHRRIHAGGKPFVCSECPSCFRTKNELRVHGVSHHHTKIYACTICSKQFGYMGSYVKHEQQGCRCGDCGPGAEMNKCVNDFGYMGSYVKHEQQGCRYKYESEVRWPEKVTNDDEPGEKIGNQGNVPSNDEDLIRANDVLHDENSENKPVTDLNTLENSGNRANINPNVVSVVDMGSVVGSSVDGFVCRHCDMMFNNGLLLEAHVPSHFFHCRTCGKQFTQQINYDAHMDRHESAKGHGCEVCKKAYHSGRELKQHMRTHLKRVHVCPVCSHPCISASTLRLHMYIHTGEKPHVCSVCAMAFRMKHQLKKHLETHEKPAGEAVAKPHARPMCEQCGHSFYDKQALKKHELLHIGVKPYVCQYCPKAFPTRGGLGIHESAHLGVKRFKCVLCSKAFRANRDFKLHMANHDPDRPKPYRCTHCSESYRYKKALRNHMKSHEVT